MRAPLEFNAQQLGLMDETACGIQVLYMLGYIDSGDFFKIVDLIPEQGEMLEVLLRYGAHAHSISPVEPQLLQGRGGEKHLAEALRQMCFAEETLTQAARQLLPQVRSDMQMRIKIAKDYRKQYGHECRVGTRDDVRKALESDRLVCTQFTEVRDRMVVIMPGDAQAECYVFDPFRGGVTPSVFEWVAFYTTRLFTIYGNRPFR